MYTTTVGSMTLAMRMREYYRFLEAYSAYDFIIFAPAEPRGYTAISLMHTSVLSAISEVSGVGFEIQQPLGIPVKIEVSARFELYLVMSMEEIHNFWKILSLNWHLFSVHFPDNTWVFDTPKVRPGPPVHISGSSEPNLQQLVDLFRELVPKVNVEWRSR